MRSTTLIEIDRRLSRQAVPLHAPSYAHGPSTLPLLGETIGECLRRTVARFGRREALVVPAPGLPRDL